LVRALQPPRPNYQHNDLKVCQRRPCVNMSICPCADVVKIYSELCTTGGQGCGLKGSQAMLFFEREVMYRDASRCGNAGAATCKQCCLVPSRTCNLFEGAGVRNRNRQAQQKTVVVQHCESACTSMPGNPYISIFIYFSRRSCGCSTSCVLAMAGPSSSTRQSLTMYSSPLISGRWWRSETSRASY
jgi:hypothetical protein